MGNAVSRNSDRYSALGEKLSVSGFLYIVSMMVVLNPTVAGIDVPRSVIWAISIFWIVYGLIHKLRSSVRNKSMNIEASFSANLIDRLAGLFLAPKIAVWAYGIGLFVVGVGASQYATTGVTQLVSVFLPVAALLLFGTKTVEYTFYSCAISFIPQIVITLIVDGPDAFVQWLSSLIYDGVSNPFENHSVTFTAAFLFVYYIGIDRFKREKNAVRVLVCAVMLALGFKRILVLSVAAALLLSLICNRVSIERATSLLKAASMFVLAGCWLFLVLIYNGSFFDLLQQFGINAMGRNYYYAQVASITDFSPSFLGLGLNAVSRMFTSTYSYMHVGGVHSDILKYYAEIGFIGFALWSWFYLLKLPKMIDVKFGLGAAYALRLVNILTFITYLTDNIDIYYGSQLLYVAIPVVFCVQYCSKARIEQGESEKGSSRGSLQGAAQNRGFDFSYPKERLR